MEIASFERIEDEFMERIRMVVWCNMATVDARERPRSRVVHPVWDGPVGWLWTRRETLKARHIARNPHVSLAYVADVAKPVYIDCTAEWAEDVEDKQRIWDYTESLAPPFGYDPEPIYGYPDNPKFGLLRLTPWRLELCNLPNESLVWHERL